MEMNKQKEREPRPKETKEEGRTEPAVQLTVDPVQPLKNCLKKYTHLRRNRAENETTASSAKLK